MGGSGGRPKADERKDVTILEGEGVKCKRVKCNHCGHEFAVSGASRIKSHFHQTKNSGIKGCTKPPELHNASNERVDGNIESSNLEQNLIKSEGSPSHYTKLNKTILDCYMSPKEMWEGISLQQVEINRGTKRQRRIQVGPFSVSNVVDACDLQLIKYVFDPSLDESEFVFSSSHSWLKRLEFTTLKPESLLDSMIIDIFVEYLTDIERKKKGTTLNWYLPVTFSTCALSGDIRSFLDFVERQKMREIYMSKLVDCGKMFIPVHVNKEPCGHFYLYVIHLKTQEIEIWDSLRPFINEEERRDKTRKLLLALTILFMHDVWNNNRWIFSNFREALMDTPQQHNGYDCGIFVINFMQQSANLKRDPAFQFRSDEERLNLALKLLKSDLNKEREILYDKAAKQYSVPGGISGGIKRKDIEAFIEFSEDSNKRVKNNVSLIGLEENLDSSNSPCESAEGYTEEFQSDTELIFKWLMEDEVSKIGGRGMGEVGKTNKCFLHFVFSGISDKEALIRNYVFEGLIDGMKSLKAQYDEGYTILNIIKNNSLLEEDAWGRLQLHELSREMASNIVTEIPEYMAKSYLKEIPNESEWKDLQKVSLMWSGIEEIPKGTSPKCPKLSTLLLGWNLDLKVITDDFFMGMPALRVLDLSDTSITRLPKSVSNLECLVALLLGGCESLSYVPSLAKLRQLMWLDLCGTAITEVPPGLEMLINLRLLDLRMSTSLKMSTASVISKLANLQSLYLNCIPKSMDVKAQDLQGLKKLETISANFSDGKEFNDYVLSFARGSGLRNYILTLNNKGEPDEDLFCEDLESKENAIKAVELEGMELENLPEVLPGDLTRLVIIDCHLRSRCLCHGFTFCSDCSFQRKYLRIGHCDKLENNVAVPVPSFSPALFSQLRYLSIARCKNIKKLLMSELSVQLQNLEEIDVEDCESMKEIFSFRCEEEEEDYMESNSSNHSNNEITLPKLQCVILEKLQELNFVYKGILLCPSLCTLQIRECEKLLQPHILPALQKREVQGGYISQLRNLSIVGCKNIKKLPMSELSVQLQNLEAIRVEDCESMKEIFSFRCEEEEEEDYMESNSSNHSNNEITLPKLRFATLGNLRELNFVYKGILLCPSLCTLQIRECEKLLQPHILPALQKREVQGRYISQLRNLSIVGCKNIKKLPMSELSVQLQNLERIRVEDCESMKEIFSFRCEEEEEEDYMESNSSNHSNNEITLPKLRFATLVNLRELNFVYKGILFCPSLRTLEIRKCEKLLQPHILPALQKREVQGGYISQLRNLSIVGCKNIKKLPMSELSVQLQNLEEIVVEDCESMKEIFSFRCEEEEEDYMESNSSNHSNNEITLPKLRYATLVNLRELNFVYKGVLLCPSLCTLEIRKCEKLLQPRILPALQKREVPGGYELYKE